MARVRSSPASITTGFEGAPPERVRRSEPWYRAASPTTFIGGRHVRHARRLSCRTRRRGRRGVCASCAIYPVAADAADVAGAAVRVAPMARLATTLHAQRPSSAVAPFAALSAVTHARAATPPGRLPTLPRWAR
jgi:hypothetical protein